MEITWTFADGTTSEVEVNEEIGSFLTTSRRLEANLERKERYHCSSMDAIDFEGLEYADKDTPESLTDAKENSKQTYDAMQTLTEAQRRRLEMLANGMSIAEIARREMTSFNSVKESLEAAQKKFKRFFEKHPQ